MRSYVLQYVHAYPNMICITFILFQLLNRSDLSIILGDFVDTYIQNSVGQSCGREENTCMGATMPRSKCLDIRIDDSPTVAANQDPKRDDKKLDAFNSVDDSVVSHSLASSKLCSMLWSMRYSNGVACLLQLPDKPRSSNVLVDILNSRIQSRMRREGENGSLSVAPTLDGRRRSRDLDSRRVYDRLDENDTIVANIKDTPKPKGVVDDNKNENSTKSSEKCKMYWDDDDDDDDDSIEEKGSVSSSTGRESIDTAL